MSTAFLLLTLLASPAANDVPTPASAFGFEPCAERELATYEGIADYFRKLDAASDRMNLYEIGKTAEGRTMLLSVISSEENLRNLDRHKASDPPTDAQIRWHIWNMRKDISMLAVTNFAVLLVLVFTLVLKW